MLENLTFLKEEADKKLNPASVQCETCTAYFMAVITLRPVCTLRYQLILNDSN